MAMATEARKARVAIVGTRVCKRGEVVVGAQVSKRCSPAVFFSLDDTRTAFFVIGGVVVCSCLERLSRAVPRR